MSEMLLRVYANFKNWQSTRQKVVRIGMCDRFVHVSLKMQQKCN